MDRCHSSQPSNKIVMLLNLNHDQERSNDFNFIPMKTLFEHDQLMSLATSTHCCSDFTSCNMYYLVFHTNSTFDAILLCFTCFQRKFDARILNILAL